MKLTIKTSLEFYSNSVMIERFVSFCSQNMVVTMSAPNTSAPDKRAQREAAIIQSALSLLIEKGFLDLKMSEVAKAARFSMGTVYSHFSSKEDLLLGCAITMARTMATIFQQTLASSAPAMEQLLTLKIAIWLCDAREPQRYFLRQLAMNPDIWQRASTVRAQELNTIYQSLSEVVVGLIRQLMAQNPAITDASKETENDILMGIWCLGEGLFQIRMSGFGLKQHALQMDSGFSLLTTNLAKYLQGWGWQAPFSQPMIDECRRRAEYIVNKANQNN